MRVLVNAISAKRGGIVTYTANLIEALHARHVDATFATPPELARDHPQNTMTIGAGGLSPLRRLLWEQLVWRRLVARAAPDVLYSSANFGLIHCPVPQVLLIREGGLFDPFYLANTAPAQGARIAVQRHFRRRLMLLSARRADHVFTPSRAMRDALLLWAPDIAGKCTVNPYGTIRSLYAPPAAPRPWRGDGVLRLLYVSVYYPHKNPGILCRAVDRLNRDGIAAHATITMEPDELSVPGGALDRMILSRARAAGTASLGHHAYHELPALYRAHDVFVFPSVSETFGHPMAEALSVGIPVVAADTPINREICGEAAVYFKPFSTTGLVDRLRELDRDPALRARLRGRAVERARGLYDWNSHVDRLIETFERVRDGHARRKA